MRIDRFVTMTLARKRRWFPPSAAPLRLPILMYHSISDESQQSAAYFQTVTRPALFAEQMRLLKSEGYTGVTLADGLAWLRSPGTASRPRPVVLTFDDGFRDFLTAAAPVLQQNGFGATMYLPTGFIGDNRRQFNQRGCLTWSEVVALHSAGFEIGSHTVTHRRLTQLGWAEIRTELLESRHAIEQQLQSPITAFAYPSAFPQESPAFVTRFQGLLRDAGYGSCVTTKIGRVGADDERFCLRRLPANSCDDAALLLAKLEGAYDWLGRAQAVVRRIKRITTTTASGA